LKDPWRSLMRACVNKVHGHSVQDLELPEAELDDLEDICRMRFFSSFANQVFHQLIAATALTGIVDLRRHQARCSVEDPGLLEQDRRVIAVLTKLTQCFNIGFGYSAVKCDEALGDFARKAIQGEETPFESPMVCLVRDPARMIDQVTALVSEAEVVAL
ncbi:hypothetical protein BGZ83_000384, partial [Gryganskiella cystojenkinii]